MDIKKEEVCSSVPGNSERKLRLRKNCKERYYNSCKVC